MVILILLVLIPTLGVVAITLQRAGVSYRETSRNQLLATANLAAQSVESELRATSQILQTFAPAPGARKPSGGPLLDGRLASSLIEKGPSGFIMRTGAIPGVPTDLATKAASTGQMAVSDIFMSSDTSPVPMLAIAVPIEKSTGGVAVSTLVSKPAALVQALMREGGFANSLVLAVTDGTGRVIARSRDADKFIGKPVPDWQTLIALKKTAGTFEARTIEGPKVIFAFQTIRGTPGWVAVVGEPLNVFNARWRAPVTVLLAASAATLLFAFLFAMLLARRILLPIKHLAQHARAVAEGADQTLSEAAPPSFVAEFETLRRSLEGAETETRRNHYALQQSYEALRQAERLAKIGNWTLDLATGRFTCSDMLYEINGADPAGPPLTVADLQTLLAPESFERVSAAIAACAETGQPYGMEVEHLRADGTRFLTHVQGQAQRDGTGRVVSLSGVVQDISERQEERERLATLADNLPSGVIYRLEETAGGELVVTYMSAGIGRLTGVPAAEIIQDRSAMLNAIHPEDRAGYAAAMEHSRVTGASIDHTVRVNTRDGRLIWLHVRSAPRRQADGRTVWDGIARNITGERLAAEALREAKETAEAAERTKSDFLATMSHEIRTPMNTMIGMTRLTLQTPLAPKQRNYLEKIDISAKILLGIINDVLDFSKIEAGGLELEDTEFALESILESVSAVMAMPAEEKGLEIAYAVVPDAPRRLRGDPLRLGQVLTNLVSNAVKFTETGEVVISIEPSLADDGSPLLQFTVRDTGIGLTADQITGLFRPFTQAGHDTTRKYGGTGLGLAICKQLVEMMGGQIWVDSTPGEGSAFSFTIAAHPVGDDSVADSPMHNSPRLKGRRVLIVDDNASARQILSDMVDEFGLVAETVDSGARALALLRSEAERGQPFDIVLMDWRMPTMDGLETARRIRADEKLLHMPAVLMVTAFGREEVLRGAEQLGLEGVLIKPITESVMFNTILDILSPSRRDPQAPRAVEVSASRGKASRDTYAKLKGKRVLVVDDNAFNREVASDFLALVGVDVETAADGVDALAKLEAHDFDAVLMDMHMPQMDGLTAVREIRKQHRWSALPVIALTAQARIEDQAASLKAGMTAHLTKPIDETALYRTLTETLGLAADDTGKPKASSRVAADGVDFDLTEVIRRFGGRAERRLESFLRDNAEVSQRLEQCLGVGNTDAIAAMAHILGGSAGYFGAHGFGAAAQRLERAARDGDIRAVSARAPVFQERLANLLRNAADGLAALRDLGDNRSSPTDPIALRSLISRAVPLIQQGDYAANRLLEDIRAGLLGHPDLFLAEEAQAHYDDLELESAAAALLELQARLEATGAEQRP